MNFSKLTVCALLLSATAFTAPKLSAADLCENSVKTICDDTAADRAEGINTIKRLQNEILTEANPIINKRVNEFLAKTPKYRWIKRITQPMRIRNQEIMKIAKIKFPEIDSFINDKQIQSTVKNYMFRAIENSNFSTSTKYSMQATIDQVKMISFTDYIDLVELDDKLLKNITHNACGSSGLEQNAFAVTIKKKDYVVICPGFIIQNSYGKSRSEMFDNSLFVIGHELGHHIDSNKFGAAPYTKYLTCMTNNYSKSFNASKSDLKFCQKEKTSTEECNARIVNSHSGELIGDVWGMKVASEHAKTQALGIFEASQILVKGMGVLCGATDVGLHPSGNFRTGDHIAISPDMNEMLNCGETKVTCNF